MATYFWVGDSGNWSDTGHWSLLSGGVGGVGPPGTGDTATFDDSSFTGNSKVVTLTADATASILDDNVASWSWDLHFNSGSDLTIESRIDLLSYHITSATNASRVIMTGTSSIVGAFISYRHPITFEIAASATASLSGSVANNYLEIDNLTVKGSGTFNLVNTTGSGVPALDVVTVSVEASGTFKFDNSGNSQIRILVKSWTVSASGTINTSSYTDNGNIIIFLAGTDIDHSASSFAGGGKSYPSTCFWADPVTVTGSNTYTSLTMRDVEIDIAAGSTQTATNWFTDSGNLVTLRSSSPGDRYTFANTTGDPVELFTVDIQDAIGSVANGATWFYDTETSVNAGNNLNFNVPTGGGSTLMYLA